MLNYYLDGKLTLKEKGIIAVFKAHKEYLDSDWITYKGLYLVCPEGDTALRNTLNSLMKKGLVVKKIERLQGCFTQTIYALSKQEVQNA